MPPAYDLDVDAIAAAISPRTRMVLLTIMQYALPDIDLMSIDLAGLQSKRDRMAAALGAYGYELRLPEATFYLLVKAPIEDDVEFARRLRRDDVLVIPGRTVDMPGYFRISLTATDDMIDRALPVFEAAIEEMGPRATPTAPR